MELLDINGSNLRSGQHVAWATVEMGHLATGVVLHLGTQSVKVKLDSNGRSVYIPWNPRKFVILSYDQALDLDYQETTVDNPQPVLFAKSVHGEWDHQGDPGDETRE